MTDAELDRAVTALRQGEAIGLPTETVYGLGADAGNPAAVRRVFELKGRPPGHPLIVHLAAGAELERWTRSIPEPARRLAARFWPGPLTLILPRAPGVLDEVTGGQDSVGIRVPRHPLARRLLEAFGGGIAAPSANRYGRVSPTTAQHVRDEFGEQVPVVLDGGPCEVGLESTIVSCLGELLLLRPGGIPASALEAEIGLLRRARQGEGPRAPGTTVAHYAPVTPLRALAGAEFDVALRAPGVAVLARSPEPRNFKGRLWIEAPAGAESYGHDLYANLRRLDRAGASSIVLERVPAGAGWEAVRDRLERAAAACDAEELA